jgi:hypothetical protein
MMKKSKIKNNDQEERLEASDEEQHGVDQQYEQDRLTDDNAYSEYFEGDENKSDRLTDDYHEDLKD